VTRSLRNKIEAMDTVKRAGYSVPLYAELDSGSAAGDQDEAYLAQRAEEVGYPLVVKSARGGRGRGARVVLKAEQLLEAVDAARREAQMIYGDDHLYLEKGIAPSHYVAVQILADSHGNMVHLGEREGSLLRHNQKLIEESPAPSLNDTQRTALWQMALDIARLFRYQNAGAVEFLVDEGGNFHFTELKGRIQIEHAVSEMVSDVDIVAEQIRIAAGEPLGRQQADIRLSGWAMQCRVNAEDPWNDYLPSPGLLTRFRLPQGPGVRVDTYGYAGCEIPQRFDPLLANLIVRSETREDCVQRLRRALQEFRIVGVQTNLPLHMQILHDEQFVAGDYDTRYMTRFQFETKCRDEEVRKDLAAMVAVAYALRGHIGKPQTPERIQTGWHRSARRLPV
jgi:acetyl/propionyl-CoA carboxylase alpha subunit